MNQIAEALNLLDMLQTFAYANGFHECGYDPVQRLREALMPPTGPSSPRILDEREVRAIAKKVGLAKYMWDTAEGRMDLARFAHEASLFATPSPIEKEKP